MRREAARWAVLLALSGGACRQDMYDQSRLEPYERSAFFPGGASARLPVPGTVAQGRLELEWSSQGEGFPFEIDRPLLERGRREYTVFCSPCHGLAGYGDGTIVRRGFPPPPSFHSEPMRGRPPAHYVAVIENGFGVMFDYADRVAPRDRWAIAAYILALQASQSRSIEDVPADVRRSLEEQ